MSTRSRRRSNCSNVGTLLLLLSCCCILSLSLLLPWQPGTRRKSRASKRRMGARGPRGLTGRGRRAMRAGGLVGTDSRWRMLPDCISRIVTAFYQQNSI